MKKHYRTENDCLNCGTTLEGKFCHNCGQENLKIKEGFGHTMGHLIGDYLHFDTKFFQTLTPLLFRPGYLTAEYLSGKRVQYLHPVKMYIFISVVYFLIFFKTGHQIVNINDPKKANTEYTGKGVHKKNITIAAKAKSKPAESNEMDFAGGHVHLDTKGPPAGVNGISSFNYKADDSTLQAYYDRQNKLPADKKDNFFMRGFTEKYFDYHKKYGDRAQDVFLEDLQHNIPKMMFLLLPILALIVKVTFWKNRKFYVEHLIYTFHLHCFVFLFLTIIMILQLVLPISREVDDWLEAFVSLYIFWYTYRSLRVMYHRNVFRTVTKIIGMSFVYVLAFLFCISLVLVFTTLTL